MAENIEDEVTKDALKKTEEKEVKRDNIFSNIPTFVLVLLVLGLILIFITAQNAGEDGWKKVAPWILLMIILFVIFGLRPTKTGMLTEMQAKALLKKNINEKIRSGEIERNINVEPQLECDLKIVDGKPRYYVTGAKMIYPDLRVVMMQIKINAWDGNITWQRAAGQITGREPVQLQNMIPKLYREAEKVGLLRQMLKGGK